MKRISIFMILLLMGLLTACSSSSDGSIASVVFVEGKEYYGQKIVNKDQYTIHNKIGEVKYKIDKDKMPKEEFSSNTLEVGTPIYNVKENKNILLVKHSDEEYQVFSDRAIED